VLRALAEPKSKGICSFEYHLAGDGDRAALEKLAERLGIRDLVVFEGVMPHDQIFAWLDSMDIYIQPSAVEGLSRALLEAMSRGLPAFASDAGGNPELLPPACLHRYGDVSRIVRQLESLTPDTMLDMAGASFEKAGKYEKDLLENRRRDFYARFAASLKGEAGGRG
jgi:glycosyltransferase involved in cell wall biosynthesis